MTTESELYKSIGVRGYSSLECWRKDGTFHLRLAAPASFGRLLMAVQSPTGVRNSDGANHILAPAVYRFAKV